MFLKQNNTQFLLNHFNCHEYFSEATNGYIMYSNVESKYDTADDNSFQLTFHFIKFVHGKINTRMKQDYAENLRQVQELKQAVFDHL
jgi:hypothetical protein